MVDVAELVMRGRAEGFDEANAKLRTTQGEAAKTEGAVESMGKSMDRIDAHTKNMTRALAAAETRTKAMSLAGLNLGRQFTDVGVTMAMGMNPFMIAIQQGPQIIDAFQGAALQMGTTVRGAMVAMGTAIWTALAPLLPIIAAIAAAAAVGFGSFALATRAAGKEIGDLTEGMNLSEAQLRKLKAENVSTTTTMGDVWNAAGTTIKEGFFDLFGDQVEVIGQKWNEFLDAAWKAVVATSKNIGGAFLGAFYVIKDTWRLIPAALGDAAITAANAVLGGIERMINGGVALINKLVRAANKAADAIPGMEAFIPELDQVQITRIANQYEGAMESAGRTAAAAFGRGMEQYSNLVDRTWSRFMSNLRATGQARVREAAGDAADAVRDVGASARQAADDVQVLREKLEDFPRVVLLPLEVQAPEVVDPLISIVEELRLIDGLARDAAYGMAEAFGDAGRAVGDALVALSSYQAISAQIALDAKEGRLTQTQAAREQANLQIRTYGDMASAAKGFFDEQSSGYKALQAVEQVYRAWQLATSVAAVAQGWLETGQSVAQAGVKASADTAAGGAKMFSQLGIYAFPLVGAMVAVMAGLGSRGGGSVSTPSIPTTNTGTGTVLGEPDAQSASISKSLETAEKLWNKDVQLSNEMVRSLRAIETEIGSMTTLIARQVGVGGGFDTSGLGLGTSTSRSLFGLLSTTRTSSLVGQGLSLNTGNLAQLIAQGVTGSLYQLVENSKTKSGFLGFGGGTTTWTTETRTPMDRELGMQMGRILDSLRTSVLTAAGTIGVEGAEATLNAMVLNLGRIDFTGLSSAEISEKLNAVFSAAGDKMVQAILPGLVNYQEAGEGLLETLTRLATTFTAVDTTLATMGMTFNAVGLGSLNARLRLVELSGGLEAFTDSAAFFVSEFLTEAQQIAPIQAAVSAELQRLGIATDITREQFAAMVMGLDVSTEAGAAMYAALMNLAPALDKVLDYQEELAGSTQNLANLEAQRRELEIRLMEAQGRIAEALAARRAEELARMDESLRPLQQAIWAQEDLAAAAAELAATEAEAANQLASIAAQRRDMEIELLEAQGRATEALQARRDLELASLDASLRPLQMAIWAALDAAAAQEELAQAQQKAADEARQLAEQRSNLEIQLMEATGRSAEALARQREMELAALDATLRPLQEQIWAALDAAEANAALAQAQQEAADRAAQIASQRQDLEIQLLEAQGRATEALAASRALELASLDATLRPLQEQIWATLDAAAAAEELAASQEAQADAARQLAEQRRDLEIRLMEAQGMATEALAARRELEIAALDESLRPLMRLIYASEDLAEANAKAAQAAEEAALASQALAEQRRGLEIDLLEAQGRSVEALAARRALEIAALDESLRPLQELVWATLDASAANEEATRTAEEAAEAARQLAQTRRSMEIDLLEALGQSSEALAARRQMELEALDPTLRALQAQIWAAQDLAAANEAAAQAQAESAAAAEEVARQAEAIAAQRRGLEIDLLEALGQSSEALAARRQMELEAMDPALRALQQQIWAAQDAAAANLALAEAQQAAADKAAQLASQQQDLQLRLLEAQGNSGAALTMRRQQELANTDESLRALLQSIYVAEDAAAAAERAQQAAEARRQAAEERRQAAMQRAEEARDVLTQAYEREAGALQETIDKFAGFAESLRAFRDDLTGSGSGEATFAKLRAEFERVASLARMGNEQALGDLQGVSQGYLDAALQNAGSALEYQRAVASVVSAVDAAIDTSDRQKSIAEQQLAALDNQVKGLIDINESVVSVRDAITALQAAMKAAGITKFATGGVFSSPTYFDMGQMAEEGPEAIMPLTRTSAGLGVHAVNDNGSSEALLAEVRALRSEIADLKAASVQTAVNTGGIKRKMDRQEVDGVFVRGEAPGEPVEVVAA